MAQSGCLPSVVGLAAWNPAARLSHGPRKNEFRPHCCSRSTTQRRHEGWAWSEAEDQDLSASQAANPPAHEFVDRDKADVTLLR